MSNQKDYTPAPWLTDTIAADKNNYNPNLTQGLVNALRLTASGAPRNITGMTGGYAGRQVTIFNIGANAITLKDASGSSSAANRFALSGDVVLQQDQSCKLIYDAVSAVWRLESTPQVNAAGIGTVTSVSVTAANGVSGVVATATTTPAITITLGAITPTTVDPTGIVTIINEGLHILDTNASHDLVIKAGSDLTADRILTLTTGDAARTVTLGGDLTVSSAATISGTNTGDQLISSIIQGNLPSQSQNQTRYYGQTTDTATGGDTADISDPAQNKLGLAILIPRAGTLRNLHVTGNDAPAAGQTFAFTIMKGGVAEALTCTVTDAGKTASDVVNTVTVAAGDVVAIRQVTSATSGTNTGATVSMEFRAS